MIIVDIPSLTDCRDSQSTLDAKSPKYTKPKRTRKDDPWLDEFMCSLPGALQHTIDDVIEEVSRVEQRDRKRRADDDRRYRLLVDVVVSNLVYSYLMHHKSKPIVVCR
jgi:hypothetical protein